MFLLDKQLANDLPKSHSKATSPSFLRTPYAHTGALSESILGSFVGSRKKKKSSLVTHITGLLFPALLFFFNPITTFFDCLPIANCTWRRTPDKGAELETCLSGFNCSRKPKEKKFIQSHYLSRARRNGSLDPRRAAGRLITSSPKSCRRPIRGIGAARAVNVLSGPDNNLRPAINNKAIRGQSTALAAAAVIFQLSSATGARESLCAFLSCP